jgi:excisionase family DNA binding protein
MSEQWLSTQQAAELIGYHPNYIRKLIRTNKVKARKFATVWQVDRTSLLAYIRTVGKLGEKRGPKGAA